MYLGARKIIKTVAACQTRGSLPLLLLLPPLSGGGGGVKDTAPPLGDIAESFYFDSAGVGRGNFIDFERDSGAFLLFFYRVIEDFVSLPENAQLSDRRLVVGEIKIERVVYYSARVRCAQLSGIRFSLALSERRKEKVFFLVTYT